MASSCCRDLRGEVNLEKPWPWKQMIKLLSRQPVHLNCERRSFILLTAIYKKTAGSMKQVPPIWIAQQNLPPNCGRFFLNITGQHWVVPTSTTELLRCWNRNGQRKNKHGIGSRTLYHLVDYLDSKTVDVSTILLTLSST